LERTIARVRWGAGALALVTGPFFPNLSLAAVIGLAVAIFAYNLVILRSSATATTLASHQRVAALAFGADLAAVSVAMLIFSVDPYWTTFVIGPLVIIAGAFRFGGPGAYVAAAVVGLAYLAISVARTQWSASTVEPQRIAFHLSVFALSAILVDRLVRDLHQIREENDKLLVEASETRALRELDRLKDELLAAVSHELRTPLTVIHASLEMLARDGARLGERDAELVSRAQAHAKRLEHSVDDLLDLAQLEEARVDLQKEFVPLDPLLADAAAMHEPLAAERAQTIEVRDLGAPSMILVDRRRMHQVIGNLLQNAIRYSQRGTRILLSAEQVGDRVRISVTDSGPGIPPAERERVFERFYRGERAKASTNGSGLGLAIVRMLVDLHGGRVWIEAAPEGGARFVVELPSEGAPAEALA
jgi:signal transduction histidine kinase